MSDKGGKDDERGARGNDWRRKRCFFGAIKNFN